MNQPTNQYVDVCCYCCFFCSFSACYTDDLNFATHTYTGADVCACACVRTCTQCEINAMVLTRIAFFQRKTECVCAFLCMRVWYVFFFSIVSFATVCMCVVLVFDLTIVDYDHHRASVRQSESDFFWCALILVVVVH